MTDIHDHIRQLTRPLSHRAEYLYQDEHDTLWTREHTTLVPSLIDQLADTTLASDGAGAGGSKSRPPAWLEPLDTLAAIDGEAAKWVRMLGHDDPADTKACLSKLHGLHASATDEQKRAIERDIRGWWTQARIITGWDAPAWRPDNTCPMCDERRTLRVKFTEEIAFCTDCRATWEPENISLLAAHILAENGDSADTTPAA